MTRSASISIKLKIVVLTAAIAIFAVNCWKSDSSEKINVTLTAADEHIVGSETTDKDYGRFSHTVPEHAEISCDSCHDREGTTLKYAGHNSCINCHMGEFVKQDSNICVICHTNSPANPAELQAFPARFDEGFSMSFDHAQHSVGDARPAQGCAACHYPQGASRTISVGISTHSQCFTCHTQESNIGSCNTCHAIEPYARVQPGRSNVLGFAFSHADHNSVGCADCHSPKSGAPMGRQITFPTAVQHFSRKSSVTCATCHNDRRAFGERDFTNCARCHKGSGFTLLPK